MGYGRQHPMGALMQMFEYMGQRGRHGDGAGHRALVRWAAGGSAAGCVNRRWRIRTSCNAVRARWWTPRCLDPIRGQSLANHPVNRGKCGE